MKVQVLFFKVGGSSVPPESSASRPFHEVISERLDLLLAQEQSSNPSSRAKGISIKEGHSGEDDPTIVGL